MGSCWEEWLDIVERIVGRMGRLLGSMAGNGWKNDRKNGKHVGFEVVGIMAGKTGKNARNNGWMWLAEWWGT